MANDGDAENDPWANFDAIMACAKELLEQLEWMRRARVVSTTTMGDRQIDTEFLDQPLYLIDFGKGHTSRVRQMYRRDDDLNWVKIATVRELVTMTEEEVLRAPNIGRKTLERIKTKLAEHGLYLGWRCRR